MLEKNWLIFDVSSVAWQNLLAGKDRENGREVAHPTKEGRTVLVNSAQYGFDNFVNNLIGHLRRFNAAPRDVILAVEGKSSKTLRQSISESYKAGRDHAPESYEEFSKLVARMEDTILGLGGLVVTQDGIEADDVICYLSQRLKRCTVISNDGDLLVLQREGADVFNTGRETLNENKYGPFSPRFITLYKALVGDPTDRIKGAHGFGPQSFIDLLCTFREEGLEAMEDLIKTKDLGRLVEDVGQLKSLQKIIDDQDAVYTSWDLARMYPEKVNSIRMPLTIKAGMVRQWDAKAHDTRLKQWYGASRLVHATNYADAKAWMLEKLLESPEVSTDIETSTPEESDEWLRAKKRSNAGEDADDLGVDTLGSELTGLSLTFGRNCQYSLYFTADHLETDDVKNVAPEQIREVMELVPVSKPNAVHNASFELPVLHAAWGEVWKDNGWHGFLPNVYDTMVMKSFVDENTGLGLKKCSRQLLNYEQTSYDEVTQGRKMNQIPAVEVVAYGNDDTITSAALFNYCRFVMELEDTLGVFEQVGRKPRYLNALRFLQGCDVSLEKMFELEAADQKAFDAAWAHVRDFLIRNGWEGTVCPRAEKPADITAAFIKEAHLIVTGEELKTQVRTPEKLVKLIEANAAPDDQHRHLLVGALSTGLAGDVETLNKYLKISFKGEPEFNTDSPKQMQRLLYETLKLPVRLRQKPTDAMRSRGIKEGNPKGDDFALEFAIKFDAERGDEVISLLKAIQTMRVMSTRRKLYYVPYRNIKHWKTNRVHSNVNQFSTVTRRDSDSDPNKQQLGKNVKHGHKPRIREVYVAHRKDAVVVSIDFSGQELRIIADRSKDPNMLACFVPPPGGKTKDMHALTGSEIMRRKPLAELVRLIPGLEQFDGGWRMTETGLAWDAALAYARWKGVSYEAFATAYKDTSHPDNALCGELRQVGKKVNFTTEYGAQALKLSETLIILPEEAQVYIDAKEAAFQVATQWKKDVITKAHRLGYTETLMGGRRHLRDALLSENRFDASAAERQGVNFEVQGSAAEQTKLAEAGLWDSGIYYRYDAVYIGPVHDELVSSCRVRDLIPFLREKHAVMTRPYGGMTVPVIADISFGLNYGEQIEVGATVDEERITKALRELGFADMMMA